MGLYVTVPDWAEACAQPFALIELQDEYGRPYDQPRTMAEIIRLAARRWQDWGN